jgi:hypothetical protein
VLCVFVGILKEIIKQKLQKRNGSKLPKEKEGEKK